jgi:hypothetical protein
MKTIIFENVDDSTTDLLKGLAEKMGLRFKIKKGLKVKKETGIITNPELIQTIEDYENGKTKPVNVDFKALKKRVSRA